MQSKYLKFFTFCLLSAGLFLVFKPALAHKYNPQDFLPTPDHSGAARTVLILLFVALLVGMGFYYRYNKDKE